LIWGAAVHGAPRLCHPSGLWCPHPPR
jgi:hypothetical protein